MEPATGPGSGLFYTKGAAGCISLATNCVYKGRKGGIQNEYNGETITIQDAIQNRYLDPGQHLPQVRDMSVRGQKAAISLWQADALASKVVPGLGRPYKSLWAETSFMIFAANTGGKDDTRQRK